MDSLPLLKPAEVWFLLLTTENPGKHFSPGCGPVPEGKTLHGDSCNSVCPSEHVAVHLQGKSVSTAVAVSDCGQVYLCPLHLSLYF